MDSIWSNNFYKSSPALCWVFKVSFEQYFGGSVDGFPIEYMDILSRAMTDIQVGKRESEYTSVYYGGLEFKKLARAINSNNFTIKFNENKYYKVTEILEKIYNKNNMNQNYPESDGSDNDNKPYNTKRNLSNNISYKIIVKMYDPNRLANDIPRHGQEINPTTYNLARINMFLHGIEYTKFDIACADTLTNPQHDDEKPFEVIVSNPPYSIKWIGDDDVTLINDDRYSPAGVLAPKGKADWAFLMHALYWLAPNGVAANVVFPGILYRGGAEQKIRKYMVDNNYIDTVIQLPDNLFYGTSIATCILVLKKDLHMDHSIRFIDATKHCIKVTNSNKLTEANIKEIYDMYMNRNENVQYEARTVDYEEIVNNDYNLSVSTYIEKEDTREKIDIKELNKKIAETVAKENELRKAIDEIIKDIEG